MKLSQDLDSFLSNEGLFKERVCALFEPQCSTAQVSDIVAQAGSSIANFTIEFWHGGPTTRHMRAKLTDRVHVQEVFGNDFTLVMPYQVVVTELTEHFSNGQLRLQLGAMKAVIILNFLFVLLGLWGIVIFWTITARGNACRKRAHSWWSEILPTAETLQVVVISSFLQLILSLTLHLATKDNTGYDKVVLYGIICGCFGTLCISLLNSWIRGESPSLRLALSVDQIDKHGPGFGEGEERDYQQIYEAGGDRGLGQLAAHDWESHHMSMEKAMGLVDLSEHVFDELKPEKDPNLLAAFLNSTLLGAFAGKTEAAGEEDAAKRALEEKTKHDMKIVPIEVPAGLHKATLRDALLQWRMRHTAHPIELEAIDWLLMQLDPGFEMLSVKVPEQARLMLVEALVQHMQANPMLQLDAAHAVRMQSTLQQLNPPRFQEVACELPEDGNGGEKVRELVAAALKQRLEKPSKRDITQEEGVLVQYAMAQLGEAHDLVSMPYVKGADAEQQEVNLKNEIEERADKIRDAHSDVYLYDHEIFTKVNLVSRDKPPDHIEVIEAKHGKAGRKARAKASVEAKHGKAAPAVKEGEAGPSTAAPPAAAEAPSPPPSPPLPSLAIDASRAASSSGAKSARASARSSARGSARKGAATPKGSVRKGFANFTPRGLPPPGRQPSMSSQPSFTKKPSFTSQPSFASQPSFKVEVDEEQKRHIVPVLNVQAAQEREPSSAADGEETPRRQGTASRVNRAIWQWWRFQRRRDKADHDRMPCWKQYFMLFLGTLAVGACTLTATVLMSVTPPLIDYFVVYSFAISLPLSLVLHRAGRTYIRYLRHQMALRRGRNVEGAVAKRDLRRRSMSFNPKDPGQDVDLEAGEAAQAEASASMSNIGGRRQPSVRTFDKQASAMMGSMLLERDAQWLERTAKPTQVMTRFREETSQRNLATVSEDEVAPIVEAADEEAEAAAKEATRKKGWRKSVVQNMVPAAGAERAKTRGSAGHRGKAILEAAQKAKAQREQQGAAGTSQQV